MLRVHCSVFSRGHCRLPCEDIGSIFPRGKSCCVSEQTPISSLRQFSVGRYYTASGLFMQLFLQVVRCILMRHCKISAASKKSSNDHGKRNPHQPVAP